MSISESFTASDTVDSFQPVYFASFVATGLWGILTMQAYLYYLKYPKDRLWFKLMIVWLWLVATTHQVLYIHGLSRLVTSATSSRGRAEWDNPSEFLWQKILMVLASTTMQGFFIYRLYVFNGGRKICLVILVPSTLTQSACGIAYAALSMENSHNDIGVKLGLVSNVFEVFVDVLTSGCMAYWLYIGRTGTARTDKIIIQLFTITVASGFWTAGLVIGTLITLCKAKNPFLKMALQIPLVSGYGNVVVANLNVRRYIGHCGRAHAPGDMGDCSDSYDDSKSQLSIQFRAHTATSTTVVKDEVEGYQISTLYVKQP